MTPQLQLKNFVLPVAVTPASGPQSSSHTRPQHFPWQLPAPYYLQDIIRLLSGLVSLLTSNPLDSSVLPSTPFATFSLPVCPSRLSRDPYSSFTAQTQHHHVREAFPNPVGLTLSPPPAGPSPAHPFSKGGFAIVTLLRRKTEQKEFQQDKAGLLPPGWDSSLTRTDTETSSCYPELNVSGAGSTSEARPAEAALSVPASLNSCRGDWGETSGKTCLESQTRMSTLSWHHLSCLLGHAPAPSKDLAPPGQSGTWVKCQPTSQPPLKTAFSG